MSDTRTGHLPPDDVRITEVHEFFSRICKQMAHLLDTQAASLFFLQDAGTLVMRGAWGYENMDELIGQATYKVGQGITGTIALGKEVRYDTRDQIRALGSRRYSEKQWENKPARLRDCWSLIGAPLLGGEIAPYLVIGVIKVENKFVGGEEAIFTEDDQEQLRIYAETTVTALIRREEYRRLLNFFRVFVSMPFSSAWQNTYEMAIKNAVEQVGLRSDRLDEKLYAGSITESIHEHIGRSRIVVAEVTDANPNVLYEVGYARAQGKPIVLLAQDDACIQKVHVLHDLRSIIYDPADLRNLRVQLEGTIRSMV